MRSVYVAIYIFDVITLVTCSWSMWTIGHTKLAVLWAVGAVICAALAVIFAVFG